ncbi:hypothetical protein B0H13DRAFT_1882888 [Mycena leptocephala]|nr:hypothetical protein B0H13DRAFT_1882888 [Mycena leptocephala]
MNIVNTATELPQTPQDINGSISVVSIGPKKFKADAINKLFRIRRDTVWAFLCWLKFTAQNPLYVDIPLSEENLLQYSEATTVLPGINDRIIHDDQSNSRQVFEEESAGVDNHPAADLQNTEDGEPVFFLENMGVSDPPRHPWHGYRARSVRDFLRSTTARLRDGLPTTQGNTAVTRDNISPHNGRNFAFKFRINPSRSS